MSGLCSLVSNDMQPQPVGGSIGCKLSVLSSLFSHFYIHHLIIEVCSLAMAHHISPLSLRAILTYQITLIIKDYQLEPMILACATMSMSNRRQTGCAASRS